MSAESSSDDEGYRRFKAGAREASPASESPTSGPDQPPRSPASSSSSSPSSSQAQQRRAHSNSSDQSPRPRKRIRRRRVGQRDPQPSSSGLPSEPRLRRPSSPASPPSSEELGLPSGWSALADQYEASDAAFPRGGTPEIGTSTVAPDPGRIGFDIGVGELGGMEPDVSFVGNSDTDSDTEEPTANLEGAEGGNDMLRDYRDLLLAEPGHLAWISRSTFVLEDFKKDVLRTGRFIHIRGIEGNSAGQPTVTWICNCRSTQTLGKCLHVKLFEEFSEIHSPPGEPHSSAEEADAVMFAWDYLAERAWFSVRQRHDQTPSGQRTIVAWGIDNLWTCTKCRRCDDAQENPACVHVNRARKNLREVMKIPVELVQPEQV